MLIETIRELVRDENARCHAFCIEPCMTNVLLHVFSNKLATIFKHFKHPYKKKHINVILNG